MKRGQVSIETLFVVGISTILLIPAMYLFYDFLSVSSEEIVSNQIQQIGKSFVENSKKMYYYGDKSKIIVDYSFPDNIENMSIDDTNTLIFNISTKEGFKEYTFRFGINVTGIFNKTHFNRGYKSFEFKTINGGDLVSIKYV